MLYAMPLKISFSEGEFKRDPEMLLMLRMLVLPVMLRMLVLPVMLRMLVLPVMLRIIIRRS